MMGIYAHAGQSVPTSRSMPGQPLPRASTRMLKSMCDAECGYTIRLARKYVDIGLPICPCGGTIRPVEH